MTSHELARELLTKPSRLISELTRLEMLGTENERRRKQGLGVKGCKACGGIGHIVGFRGGHITNCECVIAGVGVNMG